jgi:ABC-type multidrug transport system fused ATPase/permease subunit
MIDFPEKWDSLCQFTIKKYGDGFRTALHQVQQNTTEETEDHFIAFIYLFLVEYDLSNIEPLPDTFITIRDTITRRVEGKNNRASNIVQIGKTQLPISIMKEYFNSTGIVNIKDINTTAIEVERTLAHWKAELATRTEQVEQLKKSLDKQSDAYNFVFLYDGFKSLEKTTLLELSRQRKNLRNFGLLMLLPIILDLLLIASGHIHFDKAQPASLVIGSVISLTSTLIFLYFFRIVLRDVDSKDAQLMQIRLRMTLCQFIQNYATYASEVKEKTPDLLAKFENLIFSGIVGTQDKLPSTFDGLEQLSALIKNVKG